MESHTSFRLKEQTEIVVLTALSQKVLEAITTNYCFFDG